MYPHRIAMARMITRRTQWVVLSAASDNPSNGYAMWVHGSMLHTLHDHAIVLLSSLLTASWKEVVVESHIELALTSIVHSAQPMARALRRVGGAHRAPSGPRRVRRSRSL